MSQTEPAVVQVALDVPLPQTFDYLPPKDEALPPMGSRVVVPFGRRTLVGIVLGHEQGSTAPAQLKAIERVLDVALVDEDLLALHHWASRYYAYPIGACVSLLLPPALRRPQGFRAPRPHAYQLTDLGRTAEVGRAPARAQALACLMDGAMSVEALAEQGIKTSTLKTLTDLGWIEPCNRPADETSIPGPVLNSEQSHALGQICESLGQYQAFLLDGVTGSGKTEVYLQAAREVLARGQQVLMLVPEIGLSPQLIRRVESRLGMSAMVYHSDVAEGERLRAWQMAKAGEVKVVIGTRSAVFLPFDSLGLVVVDEEHDGSFKQMDGPRYHARDLAVVRAKHLNIPIVLGSATPSLESINNVNQDRYQALVLSEQASQVPPPRWRVIDQRGEIDGLSSALLQRIDHHLSHGGQVLLYRNRRGFAPVLMCQACGWQADCTRCSAHMTLHQTRHNLQCHHCGSQRPKPNRCPSCEDPNLIALGAGTQRLEEALGQHFPAYPIHRVDRDVMTGRDDFENLLDHVKQGGPCILVGTQMLAKGHHLPKVSLAAVLDVDASLFSGDFRAPEHLGQIVYQVAGRAGRVAMDNGPSGEFILQTRHPEHGLLLSLCAGRYLDFATELLAERQAAGLPPVQSLALVRAEAHQTPPVLAFLEEAQARLRDRGLTVLGPIASMMPKRSGYWRHQLWVQATTRLGLIQGLSEGLSELQALPSAKRVRWHIDVDPVSL